MLSRFLSRRYPRPRPMLVLFDHSTDPAPINPALKPVHGYRMPIGRSLLSRTVTFLSSAGNFTYSVPPFRGSLDICGASGRISRSNKRVTLLPTPAAPTPALPTYRLAAVSSTGSALNVTFLNVTIYTGALTWYEGESMSSWIAQLPPALRSSDGVTPSNPIVSFLFW